MKKISIALLLAFTLFVGAQGAQAFSLGSLFKNIGQSSTSNLGAQAIGSTSASSTGTSATVSSSATASTKAPTPVVPVVVIKPARLGSSGANVTAIQTALIAAGFLKTKTPTGYYGAQTAAAVSAFQAANNLPAIGSVGPSTSAALSAGVTGTVLPRTDVEMPALPATGTTSLGSVWATRNMYFSDQYVPAMTYHQKIGSYIVHNDTSETVKLNSMLVGFTTGGAGSVSNLTNMQATVNTIGTGTTLPFVSTYNTMTAATLIAPGTTATVDFYADMGAATSGSVRSNLLVGALGMTSGYAYNSGSSYSGQNIESAPGTVGTCAITSFVASPSTVAPGNSSTLSWTTTAGCTSATLAGPGVSSTLLTGSASTGILATTTTYTLSAHGSTGSPVAASVTVLVTGGTSCLVTPTLTPTGTTPSQYIATGSTTGVTDGSRAVIALTSPTAATVTELKFGITGSSTATSVRVGTTSAPFVGGVAYLTGLSIPVPAGGLGTSITAYVSYPPVGVMGIPSGTSSTLLLNYVKFNCGTTVATSTTTIVAPPMYLVSSLPTLAVVDSSDPLINGFVKAGSITATADSHGNIALTQIPLTFTSTGGVSVTSGTNNITLKVGGATLSTTNPTFTLTAGGTANTTVSFGTGSYPIPAGTATTFDVYLTASTVTTSNILTMKLGSPSAFRWTDVSGSGASGAESGDHILAYPATTLSTIVSASTGSCAITSFTASPTSVTSGGTATLYWTTSGCAVGTITAPGTTISVSPVNAGMTTTGAILSTTTFTLTATGTGGTVYATVGVTVAGTTAPVWTRQSSSGADNWTAMASSADGMKLVAANSGLGFDNNIRTSTDGGITWTPRTSVGYNIYGVASSADGTKLAMATFGDYIYTSSDSGVTWTARTPAGTRNWTSIASSADGMKLVAAAHGGNMYTSTDGGVSWAARPGSGTHSWVSVASSADGTRLAAVDQLHVYTSNDSGNTWTMRSSAGTGNWANITSSADGMNLAVGFGGDGSLGYIITSNDAGATWTTRTGSGMRNWTAITSSSDGMKILAADGAWAGNLYLSNDFGATWAAQASAGLHLWRSVASSADGTRLAAGDYDLGYIWTYH